MPRNYFITGLPKSGKTTLVHRIVEELKARKLKVGGFFSPEERHHGTRTGFFVEDIASGKRRVLASVKGDGPKVSKYHVNVKSFESVSIPAMKEIEKYDVFVVDEIGRMEMRSSVFLKMLDMIFGSDVPVIASISNEYVERYGIEGEVIMLTKTNRDEVLFDLLNKTAEYHKRKKGKGKKPAAKRKRPSKKKKPRKKKEKKKKPEKKPQKPPRKRRGVLTGIRELIGF